jgi:cyanophycinase
VERELAKVLERGGVVGGTSAGAAVVGTRFAAAGAPGTSHPGLNLLPGIVVEPHCLKRNRVDRLLDVLARQGGLVGLGVDEQTALVVRGRRVQVHGASYGTVCLPPSARRPASVQVLSAGEQADLLALRRAAFARSQPPFPAEKPATPEVPKGTLIIGGGGGMPPDVWKRFIQLAGGPDASIVVIPTALEDPIPEEIGETKSLKRAGATNIKQLHTRSRDQANDPAFVAVLKDAGGVWFSGGRQWHFVDSYQDTLAEKLFHEVLKRGGVIGGSSAGASIQAEYMVRGHPLGNTVMMAEGYERGLGFLPGAAVDQHFFARKRPPDMTDVMRAFPQLLGIGIDESTVIVVQGTVFEVVGKSRVAVYDRRKPVADGAKDYEELEPGARYDMKARQRVNKE